MESEEPLSEEDYITVTDKVVLPSWMDFPDDEKPIYVIDKTEEGFVTEGQVFDSLEKAYDYVDKELDGTPDMTGIPNIKELEFTENNRLLVAFLPSDRLRLIKFTYWEFLQLNEKYQNDPENFVLAYHWLTAHPAFYYRTAKHRNWWVQELGVDEVTPTVYIDKDGKTVVALDHGTKVSEQRIGSDRYLDYRLESRAPTFEEAYIKLAKAVNTHFTIEGEDRGLEGIVPKWLENVIKLKEKE